RHRSRPFASSPAVNQGAPSSRAISKEGLEIMRDVTRDQSGTDSRRVERRYLLIMRPDQDPLLVTENGGIDGIWNVVDLELQRGAHVNDLVEVLEFGKRGKWNIQS